MNQEITFSTQYFATLPLVAAYHSGLAVFVEANENYQKRSIRNRCQLLSSNGYLTISVPLSKGKNAQMSIKDILINYDEDWQCQHLESIKACYHNSPYFEYYIPDIEQIIKYKYKYLWDLNKALTNWTLQTIFNEKRLKFSDSYVKELNADYRNSKANSWKLLMADLNTKMHYAQVFEDRFGFRPIESALDLIFCLGPEIKNYLPEFLRIENQKGL